MLTDWIVYAAIGAGAIAFLASAIKIFREYERGVMFTLGRYTRVCGPGLVIMIPVIQQIVRIDLRTKVLDVPPQDLISRDNVSVRVNAVVFYRVIAPEHAVIAIEDYEFATSQLAQTTLRSVLGQHNFDEMLAERDRLNADIQQILDEQTDTWGIKVSNVEIKRVDIDERMIRTIAQQAEAERLRRAKIINAEGELQAADKIRQAAEVLGQRSEAMSLRYLYSMQDVPAEDSSIIVFPLPLDLLRRFVRTENGAG